MIPNKTNYQKDKQKNRNPDAFEKKGKTNKTTFEKYYFEQKLFLSRTFQVSIFIVRL